MLCLALDCSAKSASAALVKDGQLLAQYFQNSGLTHSRTLLPMVENILSNTEQTLDDVDCVAISLGPGSFTGLRIGISTVKGLCWGKDIPCRGVSTLEAMAYNLIHHEGLICCVMDARRNQVYNALFLSDGKTLTRLCDDRAVSTAELDNELINYGKITYLVGDGTDLCSRELTYQNIVLPPQQLKMQSAFGVAMAAVTSGTDIPASELTPTYLRLSQAERERLEKIQNQIQNNQ